MRDKIHPQYHPNAKVYYRGEVIMEVGATVPEMHVEIWSGSHPFFTGQKSFVDTAGRVEKFQRKFAGEYFKKPAKGAEKAAAPVAAPKAEKAEKPKAEKSEKAEKPAKK